MTMKHMHLSVLAYSTGLHPALGDYHIHMLKKLEILIFKLS